MAALGEARTTHRPAIRRSPAPRGPRRVSGPARGRAAAPRVTRSQAVALPAPTFAPRALDLLKRLPDSRLVDRILRGQTWVALIGIGLIGIVFMQVTLLKMNAGIGADVERSTVLERQNADLRASVSQLSSEERIQAEASKMGLLMPPAGDVRYVRTRGGEDAAKAVRTMRAPNPVDEPAALTGAVTSTSTATATTPAPAAPATTTEAAPAATTTTAPAPTETTTPAATTTTVPPATTTAPPVVEQQPSTGAVAAP